MRITRAISNSLLRIGRRGAERPRYEIAIFSLLLTAVIGYADFISGKDITLSVVYVVPIALAAWFVGPWFALWLSALSVALWIKGDIDNGWKVAPFIFVWNGTIRFAFYVFAIVVLTRLNRLQRGLETRVEERAADLTAEVRERERLERDMLEVSEHEQRRIGQDLHDGLCQHLTGTAIVAQALTDKLDALGLAQEREARQVVELVEEAIELARNTAKGLHPVQLQADGLMQALDEFAATTADLFGVTCRFECDSPVLVRSPTIATHLYRIAQEAVSNAMKHGRATEIVITLETSETGTKLSIADNGAGMPNPLPAHDGMGLRIMADRAKVVGADFFVGRSTIGGAELSCVLANDIEADGHAYN